MKQIYKQIIVTLLLIPFKSLYLIKKAKQKKKTKTFDEKTKN